ncbi:MAG TPA: DUF2157 domain-containing protein [Thiopseudomonas sp.]|nr:DUF2157 domain-containing protein [Thiopseudomonas sp.]
MSSTRQQILDWAANGDIPADKLEHALAITQSTANAAADLRFLSRVVLAFAVALLCSGVIFFFAYNWDALSRYHKFAMAQGAILLSLLPLLRFSLQHAVAQAAVFAASLLVGALLALVGQTYQSGADTYQLFVLWALLITPWVLIARMPALWLLLLVLLNLSLALLLSDFMLQPWFARIDNAGLLLFALNACAAGLWLLLTDQQPATRLLNWAGRSINLYSLLLITLMALEQIISWRHYDTLTLVVWLLFAGFWLYLYRVRHIDLVMLSALIMATIVLTVSVVSQVADVYLGVEGLLLLLAVTVMGLSSAGSTWLKRLKRTEIETAAAQQGAQHD